jgi:hypothetical protein
MPKKAATTRSSIASSAFTFGWTRWPQATGHRPRSAPDEREQIRVDDVGVGRAHPVRQLLVHLEVPFFRSFAESSAESVLAKNDGRSSNAIIST